LSYVQRGSVLVLIFAVALAASLIAGFIV